MNILTEIIEKSDDIISILEGNGFFRKNPFCPPGRLRIELQIRMQRKWEEEEDMNLTSDEMEAVISYIATEELSNVIHDLLDRDLLTMSVNSEGQLVYSLSDYCVEFLNKGSHIYKVPRRTQ